MITMISEHNVKTNQDKIIHWLNYFKDLGRTKQTTGIIIVLRLSVFLSTCPRPSDIASSTQT